MRVENSAGEANEIDTNFEQDPGQAEIKVDKSQRIEVFRKTPIKKQENNEKTSNLQKFEPTHEEVVNELTP